MQIGSLALQNKVILAPLAGVTDSSFRILAREMGCALVFTEMISAKGAVCAPEQTLKIARFTSQERPIGIQLFGSDPEIFARATELCNGQAPDLLDINMGCPVKKVAGKGEGCALMRDPDKAYAITKAVCDAAAMPVTVKMRKGWDDSEVNAVEVALAVQEAGAAAVTVHGRTRAQGYSGRADWSVIARVKEALRVPVVGNGDIWEPQDAQRMLQETGCDAVMLARGVLGNLWLIRRTVHYLETGELLPEPEMAERVRLACRHLEMVVEEKGEYMAVREMRKHMAWYLKGMRGAAQVRNEIMRAKTEQEMTAILKNLPG
ncbi:tRNA dihydrouridine synthase DusB [Dethiobacter alkaliphilus]|uniref:tRNA dihydrouridine synthase DusB n=1 Tax=Dethiobacter alkaliphilus TaxID=427926 RepID=UPI00222785B5|nr:tRNA dihydrouridine synthase DusB [Dethiobacter alkaliphilus]MCW3491668.1 tRNA dihydrouridine synthase DusB [Dethiobacter alkaliphilus]